MIKKLNKPHENIMYNTTKSLVEAEYSDRLSGVAIVINSENNIALIGNELNDFFVLPGGGIKSNESIINGIIRECLEETGCNVKPIKAIGVIDDYRYRDKKHYISHCYLVKVKGEIQKPKYTSQEIRIGMYVKWVSLIEARIIFNKQNLALKKGKVKYYNTGFNIARDFLFFNEAKIDYSEQKNFLIN